MVKAIPTPFKIIKRILFFLTSIGYLLLTCVTYAQPTSSEANFLAKPTLYKILPGVSQVKFYGSSPFDKFTGTSTQVKGFIEGTINAVTEISSSDLKAEVRVDVGSLDTNNDKRDKKMRETLDVEKYPFITFKLNQIRLIQKAESAGPSRYQVEGAMSIHGVKQTITADVESKVEANRITISGKMPLDITDYKIDRPKVPVIAFVKLDKNVTVEFNLVAEASVPGD
jgi:polyisoprenoid-binding protein YceI